MGTPFVELPDAHCGSPLGQVIKNYMDSCRKRRVSLRTVVEAVRWLAHTGCQWRNLVKITHLGRQYIPLSRVVAGWSLARAFTAVSRSYSENPKGEKVSLPRLVSQF